MQGMERPSITQRRYMYSYSLTPTQYPAYTIHYPLSIPWLAYQPIWFRLVFFGWIHKPIWFLFVLDVESKKKGVFLVAQWRGEVSRRFFNMNWRVWQFHSIAFIVFSFFFSIHFLNPCACFFEAPASTCCDIPQSRNAQCLPFQSFFVAKQTAKKMVPACLLLKWAPIQFYSKNMELCILKPYIGFSHFYSFCAKILPTIKLQCWYKVNALWWMWLYKKIGLRRFFTWKNN